jgi:hypothetical protein
MTRTRQESTRDLSKDAKDHQETAAPLPGSPIRTTCDRNLETLQRQYLDIVKS